MLITPNKVRKSWTVMELYGGMYDELLICVGPKWNARRTGTGSRSRQSNRGSAWRNTAPYLKDEPRDTFGDCEGWARPDAAARSRRLCNSDISAPVPRSPVTISLMDQNQA